MILKLLIFVGISLAITVVLALGMILSQSPRPLTGSGGLDFTKTLLRHKQDPQALGEVAMRDGYGLKVRHYPGPDADAPLVVLVHGSGWHGLQFDSLARGLSAQANVVAPDLRGHGTAPGRRGDVDYIGQFEDDLADLIAAHQVEGQSVVLGGHSSGGGLVVRFAGGAHGDMIDGAVLLAPFLKHNAPTTRANSGGWTQVLLRRIVGLSMLNMLRIRALNHLTIIQFTMPQAVLDGPLGDTATTAYSYRLNESYAPRRDYLADVAALPAFLLVVGADDEAFDASLYAPTLKSVTEKGRYEVIPDVGHLDVVGNPRALSLIKGFLNEF